MDKLFNQASPHETEWHRVNAVAIARVRQSIPTSKLAYYENQAARQQLATELGLPEILVAQTFFELVRNFAAARRSSEQVQAAEARAVKRRGEILARHAHALSPYQPDAGEPESYDDVWR